MIAIVDYGAGNLRSVELAFARIGASAAVTSSPAALLEADGVVLPGVGAFADAMDALRQSGLIPALRQAAGCKPFLGICLGMQLLFDYSEEGGRHEGLGLLTGSVRRLESPGLKIPHIGWNRLAAARPTGMTGGLPAEPYVYFVHSFACRAADEADVLFTTDYGERFHSGVQRGRLIGLQFHPEKSGAVGERLLKNFLSLTMGGDA